MTSRRELTGTCPRCERETHFFQVQEMWRIDDTDQWIVKDYGWSCAQQCMIPHEAYTYSIFSNIAGRVIVFTPTDLGKLIDKKKEDVHDYIAKKINDPRLIDDTWFKTRDEVDDQ